MATFEHSASSPVRICLFLLAGVRVGFVTMYSMISTIDSRISYVSYGGLNLGSCKCQEHYKSKR